MKFQKSSREMKLLHSLFSEHIYREFFEDSSEMYVNIWNFIEWISIASFVHLIYKLPIYLIRVALKILFEFYIFDNLSLQQSHDNELRKLHLNYHLSTEDWILGGIKVDISCLFVLHEGLIRFA